MGMRVIVVEPDARKRELKLERLREAGHLVVGAVREEYARAAMRVSPYPLVVWLEGDDMPYAIGQDLGGQVDLMADAF